MFPIQSFWCTTITSSLFSFFVASKSENPLTSGFFPLIVFNSKRLRFRKKIFTRFNINTYLGMVFQKPAAVQRALNHCLQTWVSSRERLMLYVSSFGVLLFFYFKRTTILSSLNYVLGLCLNLCKGVAIFSLAIS